MLSLCVYYRFWETNLHILPLLAQISIDTEPAVRQHLVEQLAPLSQVGINSVIYIPLNLLQFNFVLYYPLVLLC